MRRAQTNLSTSFLREILLLRVARQVLAPQATPLRILSFGCSIGEELVTLRVLFPEAEIFGCDIDPLALKVAQARVGHLANVFKSDEAAIAARGPFDLICAFSSLCINPMPPAAVMQRQLPFSLFDDLVATLDEPADRRAALPA
ncbi:class I SAM-dependent methyltransferase [Falsiroseomonas selenitidurans]|uniref:Class I SAM-dependent methyltransferase n=1 Tax=Falsiroseomonas selenitidurans TaxID=2716335 RepID=A0ABX1DZU1_9PROT|nr:class I SAM-dependent methyltransferase [Falsiroseomonas selenitidurans]NKC30391.1 class I SAM-dependent methyltransferase [Falsiroseomonas selenitidurans]